MCKCGTFCASRSTSVVFPVPDGAETMNNWPRREAATGPLPAAPSAWPGLFDILDLLAHLLEFGLGVDDQLRDAETVGLRADGVDLAVHLLQQEIELAPARLRALGERHPVRQMGAEPRDLFRDIGPGGGADDLLRDHRLIDRQLGAE